MYKTLALSLAFVLATGTAFAQSAAPHAENHGGITAAISSIFARHDGNTPRQEPNGGASSTVRAELQHRLEGRLEQSSSTPLMFAKLIGTPGVVNTIGTNSFTMDLPPSTAHATTTITVNITSSTIFNVGSSTGAFSDISAGSRVVVVGKVSTSTKAVAARRVVIVTGFTHPVPGPLHPKGILSKIKGLFAPMHASSTDMRDHGPATGTRSSAAVENSFASTLLHSIFSWI